MDNINAEHRSNDKKTKLLVGFVPDLQQIIFCFYETELQIVGRNGNALTTERDLRIQ